jgi:hypothetical protein
MQINSKEELKNKNKEIETIKQNKKNVPDMYVDTVSLGTYPQLCTVEQCVS